MALRWSATKDSSVSCKPSCTTRIKNACGAASFQVQCLAGGQAATQFWVAYAGVGEHLEFQQALSPSLLSR